MPAANTGPSLLDTLFHRAVKRRRRGVERFFSSTGQSVFDTLQTESLARCVVVQQVIDLPIDEYIENGYTQPMSPRCFVEWSRPDGLWRALEPTPAELAVAAPRLAQDYNEPHNRAMMTNSGDQSPDDVVELWADMRRHGGRPFLLFLDDTLMGDADLRHIADGRAEFAIMVGSRAQQGRGVGTRFALMLHVLAFQSWGLERLYVSIIPANSASIRLFQKLGYQPDDSPAARCYAEEPDDVTLSAGLAEIAALHGSVFGELQFGELPP